LFKDIKDKSCRKMKDKIIEKASELFLKLGFKSVTMDDIAGEMCISKKTIYKYFCNKEMLIEESTTLVHENVHYIINTIVSRNHNAIEENFEIRKMFKEMFKASDASPIYQLKKHYPEIYQNVIKIEIKECKNCFTENINKGIAEGLYRKDLNIDYYVQFYYILIFHINENTSSEIEARKIELAALEYHTRAMATEEGVKELEKQLQINTNI
jgi:TetR/AcrR family transcriptional regulator, biofilm operon repressor